MIVWLTLLSALQVLAFVGALVAFLRRIAATLERIGGLPTSYLAKISFGVRAIEKETSHLAPQVTHLNSGLTTLRDKLGGVDAHLGTVAHTLGQG
ncbi:MAG: hypothetical protein M3R24_13255 [Chloroflexota bacterium]|nr:hypothetical protein [Chloroflexota bacterium]PLS79005.1 MAG: hypothetical protein CYG59_15560 [Chloroflexota bacterium]